MRIRSPPLAPGFDFETYIVLDDLAKLGRAYREVEEEYADRGHRGTVSSGDSDRKARGLGRAPCTSTRGQ